LRIYFSSGTNEQRLIHSCQVVHDYNLGARAVDEALRGQKLGAAILVDAAMRATRSEVAVFANRVVFVLEALFAQTQLGKRDSLSSNSQI
jgi:predicted GNAT family N-acyltransferase